MAKTGHSFSSVVVGDYGNTTDKKDSEKRGFNRKGIGVVSMFAITAVGVGAAALGGNFNVKLPKN